MVLKAGATSLAEANPELAAQWHPTKNENLTPGDVASGSKSRAWWMCSQNHEWQSTVINRFRGSRCPYCVGKRSIAGVNDLATTHPDVYAQLDLDRLDKDIVLSQGSNRKVWWKCSQGHTWDDTPTHMVRGKSCPVCLGRRVVLGTNDLATTHPVVAALWNSHRNKVLATEVSATSSKEVWWVCSQRHEWQARVKAMSEAKSPCPYCSNRQLLKGFNDFASQHPELINSWMHDKNMPVLPEEVTSGSAFQAWWQCEQGHEWEDSVSHRTRMKRGCPYCSGQRVMPGETDLASVAPDLAMQWHPTKNSLGPEAFTSKSNIRVWWQCVQEHEWESTIADRRRGYGCPVCINRKVVDGVNDLATLNPNLTKQWHPTKNSTPLPTQVTSFSNVIAWWQCIKGHEWEALVSNRSMGYQCPICSAQSFASRGEKDLRAVFESYKLDTKHNYRQNVNGIRMELDIFIPSHNFAVEFNGVYWHSEAAGKGKDYHQAKQQACADLGITLYQVWEDDWKSRREIVLRGIAHRIGLTKELHRILPDLPEHYTQTIGARQTRSTLLDYTQAAEFLEENHIQGSATGTYYLGLVDRQERLRAVLVLKRTGKTGELSIERYATAGTVSGGFTKLLTYAEKTYAPQRWVTFADLSISDGGLYEKNGFSAEKVLPPDYSYLVRGQRVHKFNYRINRFKTDPSLQYQEGLTERELADLNGLVRIWDSGKVRYVKEVV